MKINFHGNTKIIGEFVEAANKFCSDIFIRLGRLCIDGKSIMGIYSLNLLCDLDVDFVEKEPGEEDEFRNLVESIGILTN